jgi:hypothetical protein
LSVYAQNVPVVGVAYGELAMATTRSSLFSIGRQMDSVAFQGRWRLYVQYEDFESFTYDCELLALVLPDRINGQIIKAEE